MELWEFNACARAFNERGRAEDRREMLAAYVTANWTAAALAGKLKPFSRYYNETRAEMEALDRIYATEGGNHDGNVYG